MSLCTYILVDVFCILLDNIGYLYVFVYTHVVMYIPLSYMIFI